MSTEQIPEIEVTDIPEVEAVEVQTEPSEPEEQTPEEQPKPFDPKSDKVDFTTPEQQAKFDYTFKNMKMADNRNAMLTEFLAEQQKQLDELRSFKDQYTTEKTESHQAEASRVLMDKLYKARDEGDDAAYDSTLKELISFETQSAATKIVDQKVNEILQKHSQEDTKQAEFVAGLMNEKTETGDYKRPYLQENHPDFKTAISNLAVISMEYKNDPLVLEKSLAKLETMMSVTPMKKEEPPAQPRTPNPMQGSNLTNRKPGNTIKMTKVEQEILQKLEKGSGRKIDLKSYAARRDAELSKRRDR